MSLLFVVEEKRRTKKSVFHGKVIQMRIFLSISMCGSFISTCGQSCRLLVLDSLIIASQSFE